MDKGKIRKILLQGGFRIQDDLMDLKPYVYDAVEVILAQHTSDLQERYDCNTALLKARTNSMNAYAARVRELEALMSKPVLYVYKGRSESNYRIFVEELDGKTPASDWTALVAVEAPPDMTGFAPVTAELVSKLRDMTDCPMMGCKDALVKTRLKNHPEDEWLRDAAQFLIRRHR